MRLGLCFAVLIAACAATQARPNLPGTTGAGEVLPPPVSPEPGGRAGAHAGADAGRRRAAHRCRRRRTPGPSRLQRRPRALRQGDREGARAALKAFTGTPPRHRVSPGAELMLARLALLRDDAAAAKPSSSRWSRRRRCRASVGARYYLGLAETRRGNSRAGASCSCRSCRARARPGRATRRSSSCAARSPKRRGRG